MFGLGLPEILIIVLIILFIFGAKRLPSIGSGLGETVKEIRKAKKEISATESSTQKVDDEQEEPRELEDTASKTESSHNTFADSIGKKVTDKVVGQVPGIKQARQWKDKADKIKKIVN